MTPPLFDKNPLLGRQALTPSALAAKIQEGFDRDFGHIWVEGEIAEISLPHSGHAYFIIKDREARLKAVMWKGRRAYAGAALNDGLAVRAKGRLAVYAPRGDYQLVCDYLEPLGEGALQLAFEKLKAKLTDEGLFSDSRKRPLPFWPGKVAVISSASGAAVRDFIQTARKLRPGAAISLYPVRVQGEGAAAEIAQAIADLNAWGGFDLIVLTRGGGSLADLWAFNEEQVVRAVAASRTVTLAAIGHSTDLSLTELAADRQAITPTAAAELAFRDQAALEEHLARLQAGLRREMKRLAQAAGEKVMDLEKRLSRALTDLRENRERQFDNLNYRLGRFEDRLGFTAQRLDDLVRRLGAGAAGVLAKRAERLGAAEQSLRLLSPQGLLNERRQQLDALAEKLARNAAAAIAAKDKRLAVLNAGLLALSPHQILKRGYALVSKTPGGPPLTSAGEVDGGEKVFVRLGHGAFSSIVEDVEP